MILRKLRTFRRGTARYSVTGVTGLADDDRAVVSVWPGEGGVTILATVGGDRLTARVEVTTTLRPDRVPLDLVRQHAAALLSDLCGAMPGDGEPTGDIGARNE